MLDVIENNMRVVESMLSWISRHYYEFALTLICNTLTYISAFSK